MITHILYSSIIVRVEVKRADNEMIQDIVIYEGSYIEEFIYIVCYRGIYIYIIFHKTK